MCIFQLYTAEAEIGFAQVEYLVAEGQNLSVCIQLSGGLQEPVDVTLTAIPGSAQGMAAGCKDHAPPPLPMPIYGFLERPPCIIKIEETGW